MIEDDLFDDGINGEGWDNQSEAWADDYYEDENYRESYDIHIANGLEIQGWPTYGNCTIVTDTFHIFHWWGSNTLEVYDKRIPDEKFASCNKCVLTIKNQDLYFFGDKTVQHENGKWEIAWYTGEQVDQKIQRYINLKAFL